MADDLVERVQMLEAKIQVLCKMVNEQTIAINGHGEMLRQMIIEDEDLISEEIH